MEGGKGGGPTCSRINVWDGERPYHYKSPIPLMREIRLSRS